MPRHCRAKKTVIYLDLSDAFNTAEHPLLLEALRQSGCPKWIVDIIASVYRHCITSPVDLSGKKLAGDVPVSRGVRQGCPLSSLLFNLVLDPVLQAASGPGTICLGYMDDIAIIFDNPEDVTNTLARTVKAAQSLGFSFNISKCGITNYKGVAAINNTALPRVTDDRAYKYLGTETSTSTVGGIDTCIQKTWDLAEKIETSELTPMQKLHALRTYVLPKLMHLLENAHSTQREIQRINRSLRKMVKRICYLPERATNSYIHLHRRYGGPGLPNLELLKAKLRIQSFARSLNLADEFGDKIRSLMSKGKPLEVIIQQVNSRSRGGLSQLCSEVVLALKKLESFLETQMSFSLVDNVVLLEMNNMKYKEPGLILELMIQKKTLHNLMNTPSQGRAWGTLSQTPMTTKQVYSFHTPMCDWRFTHAARLSLTPLRANVTWNPHNDPRCRRCQVARETVNHVVNSCSTHRRDIILRHNAIRDLFANAVPRTMRVACEQRFGNLQPDLVLEDPSTNSAVILDVKVSAEDPYIFKDTSHYIAAKYEPLRRAYEIHGQRATTHTLQFGALGSVSRDSFNLINRVIKNKKNASLVLRKISNLIVHCARNQTVCHLTGQQQSY